MIEKFFSSIRLIVLDSKLRFKFLFVIGAFLIFRIFATVPVPGVDQDALANFFSNNQFFGLLNIFSGGGLSGLSIVMLGVGPYITASIIMQVLTIIYEPLKSLYHEEGQLGREKFMQYARLLTVPLAVIQSFSFIVLLQRNGIVEQLSPLQMITALISITAGSVLLMWLGELVTEFGIGNGVSLIIFAGILAGLPNTVRQLFFAFDPSQIPSYVGFIIAGIVTVAAVVIITEAERPIPVTYAKQVRGDSALGGKKSYLPIRINQAGVIPIIFALSILLLPQLLLGFAGVVDVGFAEPIINWFNWFYVTTWLYALVYFVLVFVFTFFYTAVTFDPESIAKNLQQGGAFIPGIRPGESTKKYISDLVTRTTLVGATFLGLIAILPIIIQGLTGIQQLTIGGTALLIAVSVIIDLLRKVDSQITMREY